MSTHLLQNMPSGHIKVKKESGHVFYMSTPCHTIESVVMLVVNEPQHTHLKLPWKYTGQKRILLALGGKNAPFLYPKLIGSPCARLD